MTADSSPTLPGRLGTPTMLLKDDPRADPRMIAAMIPFGLEGAPEPGPVNGDSSLDEILEYVDLAEPGYEQLFAALAAMPDVHMATVRDIKGFADSL